MSLRERKKARTRDTIEETALRLFAERGYDRVRLDDICAEAMVSLRTFFRYFASKEDLVLGRLRSHLAQATGLFAARPEDEPLAEALDAVVGEVARDYGADPERELARLRLVMATPALVTGLLDVFAAFERLIREVAATRLGGDPGDRRQRLLAAATVSAFRVGLELWVDAAGGADLAPLVRENRELLTRGLI